MRRRRREKKGKKNLFPFIFPYLRPRKRRGGGGKKKKKKGKMGPDVSIFLYGGSPLPRGGSRAPGGKKKKEEDHPALHRRGKKKRGGGEGVSVRCSGRGERRGKKKERGTSHGTAACVTHFSHSKGPSPPRCDAVSACSVRGTTKRGGEREEEADPFPSPFLLPLVFRNEKREKKKKKKREE